MGNFFRLIFFTTDQSIFCCCILGNLERESHKCPITNHTLSKPCRSLFCVIIIEKKISLQNNQLNAKQWEGCDYTHGMTYAEETATTILKLFSSFFPNVKRICMLMLIQQVGGILSSMHFISKLFIPADFICEGVFVKFAHVKTFKNRKIAKKLAESF